MHAQKYRGKGKIGAKIKVGPALTILSVCKFTIFEVFVCVIIYSMSALSLHIESTDSVIC